MNINNVLNPGGYMAFEGAVLEGAHTCDGFWCQHAETIPPMNDKPMACYVKETYEGEDSNWWVPNMRCLGDWVESCGFKILSMEYAEDKRRAYGLAQKVSDIPQEHSIL